MICYYFDLTEKQAISLNRPQQIYFNDFPIIIKINQLNMVDAAKLSLSKYGGNVNFLAVSEIFLCSFSFSLLESDFKYSKENN